MSPLLLEELNLNAWPAYNTYLYGGMVVRWADGFTKRANSATPLYSSEVDDNKIQWVEAFFEERQLPPIFRLVSFNESDSLAERLTELGYHRFDDSSVQVADLTVRKFEPSPQLKRFDPHKQLDEWLTICHQLDEKDLFWLNQHRAILKRVPERLLPISIERNSEPVACGLGVYTASEKVICLFDIVTNKEMRGQGLGREVVSSLLALGQEIGAEQSALQVMANNRPALALYAKFNFQERYTYWYLKK